MKTESNPTLGTPVSAVRGFRENGALRAVPRKVMTTRNRFFWWYSLSLLFLGPFGFLVGPLMARRGLRNAERLYPQEAYAARQRDQGFTAAQWWVMTPLTVMGAFWVASVISGLPMVLLVLWLQLTQ
ncbi:hypothetical protein QYZ29_09870 [Xanthomonas campestris pv. campestris]|uniref:hypothetical protein n=1 Tax=Xanthomonas campestris TaxID=339 RepID=UPI001F19CD81|nr:hypothetical protein [Xanthomonas campestris]MCF8839730.1 hypothetical protein [Xanthomonas campestris pv. campestris]MDO0880256.1 hypothetical protein [Xanthomonas campestris pv. campestris]MEA0633582.1 hypothetical protein [Xanthomonas campestris pv. campestris]MEA0649566.1 hypothetical protein [Xanthomonas campestris pv. campestris]MEA0653505.1 hypothetical protein [Xanthomonas campestris pv. campestris]